MALRILVMMMLACTPAAAAAMDTGFDLPSEYARRVREGIERNRKSTATIRVTDRKGNPLPGVRLRITQKTHDFLFGCAFPSWDIARQQPSPADWKRFEEHFLRLFNYATTENMLKWPSVERNEGSPDYTMTDNFVDWCRSHGVTIKGHCLIWGLDNGGHPKWLEQYGPEEVARLAEQHVRQVVSRYKGKIDIWDVVNEPLHCHWFETHWSPDYAAQAFAWAREANPDATLVLNEYGNQWNSQAPRFAEYTAGLERKGAEIDALGEQAHDPPRIPSPAEMLAMLDALAASGKDVHLTEMTLPSNGAAVQSSFVTGNWTPDLQGRYYRYYFTLAFSHPAVKAITLWAMWDGASWLKEGGIISKDWTPKPAYAALDDLINHEWRTQTQGTTFQDGSFTFRGFHGGYDIALERGGISRQVRMHLSDRGPDLATIMLE